MLALALLFQFTASHPPEFGRDLPVSAEMRARLDPADREALVYRVEKSEFMGGGIPLMFVAGKAARTANGICRGAVSLYGFDEQGAYTRVAGEGVPQLSYVVEPIAAGRDCAVGKGSTRIYLSGEIADDDVRGIVQAIRNGTVGADEHGKPHPLPPQFTRSSISGITMNGEDEAVATVLLSGSAQTAILIRAQKSWLIAVVGEGIAPEMR